MRKYLKEMSQVLFYIFFSNILNFWVNKAMFG